jgi:hypothetical protein
MKVKPRGVPLSAGSDYARDTRPHRCHHSNPGTHQRATTGAVLTLALGTGNGIAISTPEGKCSDHLTWRAIDPDGNIISTLTKACQGDTWNIERKP